MASEKIIREFKYNRTQALTAALVTVVVIEPLNKGITQGIQFHEYYWFPLCVFAAAIVFWNFIRVGVLSLAGRPGIVLTNEGITLTELGYNIEWQDIDGIDLVENPGKYTSYSLVISVKYDWKYIGAIRNPLLRYYRWYTKDYFGNTPFSINLNTLHDDSGDVYAAVENCFHNYKNTGIYG
ncbi:MAG: hypothetical protein JST19_06975 [Bacteroidetes bacterium]|nr:hypothetical protein [Bacteroidota bacterium]